MNEAELRHWKSLAMVELMLEFAGSAMKQDDVVKVLAQREAVNAVTYEVCQQAKKALAEKKAAAG
ncbi:hypothetical protein [Streptomyces roseolilacinus]|uniref:Uncharacterized protein n=1 Tax=Streptomyces roseolilacinus TaxID=66904 RepID=A0A918B872_9ACTN|nr:hypothetical protein [Streptomyces roseolilacinus]GGQ34185.1 hypothetical protein GCM10010249_60650 [Streptomyces roseolilacinus]